jgi:hypothetical protein
VLVPVAMLSDHEKKATLGSQTGQVCS